MKPVTAREYALPLHCKKVPRLDWDECEKHIRAELLDRWRYAKKCLIDEEFLAETTLRMEIKEPQLADLTESDLELLLGHGYIEECNQKPIATVGVFSVMEKNFSRRRFLAFYTF